MGDAGLLHHPSMANRSGPGGTERSIVQLREVLSSKAGMPSSWPFEPRPAG